MSNNKVFVRFPGENCKRTMAPSIQTRVRHASGTKYEISLYHPNHAEPDSQKRVLHREVITVASENAAKEYLKQLVKDNYDSYKDLDESENNRERKTALLKKRPYGEPMPLKKSDLELILKVLAKGQYLVEILHPTKLESKDQRQILQKKMIEAESLDAAFAVVNHLKKYSFKHIKTVYEKPLPEQAKRAQEKARSKKAA